MRTKYSERDLIEAVKTSFSVAEVCRKVGIKPVGGNYKTIKDKIAKFNIDNSHFTGQGWNVGLKFNPKPAKDKLGVALVGLGYYSTDLLAPALQQTKHCYLAGIVTGTPSKAEDWKKKYNIPDASDSQVEERLAEEFRAWRNYMEVKNGEEPTSIFTFTKLF